MRWLECRIEPHVNRSSSRFTQEVGMGYQEVGMGYDVMQDDGGYPKWK